MWARAINLALGIWLMAAPAVLEYGGRARLNDVIMGPLVVTFATVAMWEVLRPLRWVNLFVGLWLLAAPAVLGYLTTIAGVNGMLAGVVVAGLSGLGGATAGTGFGGGWSSLWRATPNP